MLCVRVEAEALNITVGGSFDSEANELITIPCGRLYSQEVTTAAPLGQRRNTSRNRSADIVIRDYLLIGRNDRDPERHYSVVCTMQLRFVYTPAEASGGNAAKLLH